MRSRTISDTPLRPLSARDTVAGLTPQDLAISLILVICSPPVFALPPRRSAILLRPRALPRSASARHRPSPAAAGARRLYSGRRPGTVLRPAPPGGSAQFRQQNPDPGPGRVPGPNSGQGSQAAVPAGTFLTLPRRGTRSSCLPEPPASATPGTSGLIPSLSLRPQSRLSPLAMRASSFMLSRTRES